jgi:hypothetical protein
MLQENSRRYMTFAAHTIISCKYYFILRRALLKSLYKMATSSKGKRTPITTPPYQVPSVDATPDQPIFLLVTTFKDVGASGMVQHRQDHENLQGGGADGRAGA